MKRIMLSAAAIILIASGAFAGTKKVSYTAPASNVQLTQLSKQFEDLSAIVPAGIEVKKNLHVYNDVDDNDEDQITNTYVVSLSGKGFGEEAVYDKNGILLSYKDEIKDKKLPDAVTAAIMEKHADAMITKDKEIIKDSKGNTKDAYKVCFKDGRKHYTAMVESNGTIDKMHKRFI